MIYTNPLIGILAGMGPKSTGPFIDQVIATCQRLTGAKYDIDFPHMMIYSLPTPFYMNRPINHDLMEKSICAGLQKLEQSGATFIAIPSNIAHLYFTKLQESINIPILNIVTETLDRLPASIKKITILGTRPVIESGIYQQGLDPAQVELIPLWQDKVDALILSIKSADHISTSLSIWEDLANDLKKTHIDTIIVACTDLNAILQSATLPFQIVDASVCLAEAIIKKWQATKSTP